MGSNPVHERVPGLRYTSELCSGLVRLSRCLPIKMCIWFHVNHGGEQRIVQQQGCGSPELAFFHDPILQTGTVRTCTIDEHNSARLRGIAFVASEFRCLKTDQAANAVPHHHVRLINKLCCKIYQELCPKLYGIVNDRLL